MAICVVATASAARGALTIYKQFLSSLEKYRGVEEWHIFIDGCMPMPRIPNVFYHICSTKGFGRIWFDVYGFHWLIRKYKISPQVIFSLQNTGVLYPCDRFVIYYHQPLPFYTYKCSLFNKFYKTYFFYHYFYPIYTRLFLNKKTCIATQTQIMKEKFIYKFSFSSDRIGVYFPKTEKVDLDSVKSYQFEMGTYNFVYPANTVAYKEQITIAYALKKVYSQDSVLAERIRIHLTFKEGSIPYLDRFLKQNRMQKNFVFHEEMSHDQVMAMLYSCDALLFPSVIETLGLPLLEAASLGIPVVANDMGYVHEVLEGYEGVRFVPVHDYDEWAKNMIACCEKREQYAPYIKAESDSWERLFRLIKEGVILE